MLWIRFVKIRCYKQSDNKFIVIHRNILRSHNKQQQKMISNNIAIIVSVLVMI